ncbi:MAG TPA: hypothetical protein VM598_14540 [Bdellovibrionota bacterium]|nr:hypothetical protein [Bdellovibrionota bacterium]
MTSKRFMIFSLVLTTAVAAFSGAQALTPIPSGVLEFAIVGDAGDWNAGARRVRDSIAASGVTALVLPGDNLYNPVTGYARTWQPWTDSGLRFEVVAIGNHHGGYEKEAAFFGMPAEWYAKSYENIVRFIVLNSDNEGAADAQSRWLDRELTTATEPFVFLVYHHPTYTVSNRHKWEEKKKFQLPLRTSLLWKHRSKLTGLIVGHDHLATVVHFNDLPVFLSGAVKDVREDRPVDYLDGAVKVKTAWYFDHTEHWAKLGFDPATKTAIVEWVRAKDSKVTCTSRVQTGQPAELAANCRR